MPVEVAIPETLRRYAGNLVRLEAVGGPLATLLADICQQHPAFGDRVLTTEGQLMAHLAVFLHGELVPRDMMAETLVQDGDLLEIMFIASGG